MSKDKGEKKMAGVVGDMGEDKGKVKEGRREMKPARLHPLRSLLLPLLSRSCQGRDLLRSWRMQLEKKRTDQAFDIDFLGHLCPSPLSVQSWLNCRHFDNSGKGLCFPGSPACCRGPADSVVESWLNFVWKHLGSHITTNLFPFLASGVTVLKGRHVYYYATCTSRRAGVI